MATTVQHDQEEPDWVVAHDEAKQRTALQQQEEQLRTNLRIARERLAEQRRQREHRHPAKRSRREDDPPSDDDFLPADYDGEATSRNARPPGTTPTDAFLTPEVRNMMQAYEASLRPSSVIEEPETRPKIFFASRTHTQLAQLVQELKKTSFGHGDDPVRCIGLGSRQHMCIHEGVRRWGRMFGTEAMNERCLEMMEGRQAKRCEFLPARDPAGQAQLDAYRDHALAEVQDMEELVQLGKQMHTCPYFAARHSVRQAELVTLPYNLLLQHDAREALQLSLDDSIVLIDEAHNLIDTILSTYTAELTQAQVEAALSQVDGYLQRFATRLKGSNEEHMRTVQVLLRALQSFCEQVGTAAEPLPSLTTSQLMARLGGTADQINVSGYADKTSLEQPGHLAKPQGRAHPMHAVEAFLLALTNKAVHGRVLLTKESAGVRLKFLLLNPSDAFQPIVEAARAVLLAGGTMEPIADFQTQLLAGSPADKFVAFSCGHIVPPDHILGAIVDKGPKGLPLEFTHDSWQRPELLDELAHALCNYGNILPHGVVVFFPSYASLDTAWKRWGQTGALERLGRRKQVYSEPKEASQVDIILQKYAASIASPSPTSPKGAILFAVVGAKLSEGINFQDNLARCVVMVGLPFPHSKSPELAERMRYMRRASSAGGGQDPGRELYLNLCMRAVNQSLGRAIRHKDDYAAFLLLDRRYARTEIQSRLPGWIRSQVHEHDRFGASIAAMAKFFRSKP
ncbi:RNA helicase [Malassezia caprae]|uniref:ATP-dependent DNA helicase CHL1 n=1 Tax=Malassezia caprae TaxID=1381934 RepID=A0AAF0E792_9BASI|nr:RNA helicase [Malassezia caprae]